ncbi:MAG: amidohydrolase family protein, partial [Symbiobacteriaceae bacterium]|nr:amidohydrolase family protein [Symbiobacteriaceae bacterium]
DGETILANGAVLIEDGVIKESGTVGDLKARHPEISEVIDYGEATILPGLIDMHVHIGFFTSQRRPSGINDIYMVGFNAFDFAHKSLSAGVTTLRDVSSPDGVCQSLIDAGKKGWLQVPRILHSNRSINATGGHAWSTGDAAVEADGVDAIRQAVRQQAKAGATWIKVMASHRSPGVSEYTQEELDAAVDEAHRHLCKIAVHSSIQPSLELCINAGFDTIEHGCDITPDQARRMVEKNITWVPTLLVHKTTYDHLKAIIDAGKKHTFSERQQETWRVYEPAVASLKANLMPYYEMGVTIVAGTDMIGEHLKAAPVADELVVMVEYGMSPLKAIAAGTSVCARVLGMEGQIGILAPQAQADILIVNGDPVADINVLNDVKAVYFGGKKVC